MLESLGQESLCVNAGEDVKVRRKYIRAVASKLLTAQNIDYAPIAVDKIALALDIRIKYEPTDIHLLMR